MRGRRLLTPHPGEMKRLFPDEKMSRAETATTFSAKHAVTLLLKGSRTIVAEAGHPLSYNTTGNPGMATGGMGDVLTGVCAALLGAKAVRLTPPRASAPGFAGGRRNWQFSTDRRVKNRSCRGMCSIISALRSAIFGRKRERTSG